MAAAPKQASKSGASAIAAPPKLSRRKKIAFTLVLFGIVLLILEVLLRLVNPQEFAVAMAERRTHVYRDWTKRDLMPGGSAHYRFEREDGTLALDYRLVLDERGLRRPDPDTALETTFDGKPRRIVHCIGDSMTMGWGVTAEEAYPARLQELLGNAFLTLNLGVDGFGLRDATERSRRFAEEYPPEVAVILPFKNDTGEDRDDIRHDRKSGLGHALGRTMDALRRNLYVMQIPVAASMMFKGRGAIDVPVEVMADNIGPDMTRETWETLSEGSPLPTGPSAEALQKYVEECRAAGLRVLVLFPHGNLYAWSMGRYCREHDIPYLVAPMGYSKHLATDLHLNPQGCVELAEAVHRALTTGEGVTGPWIPLN
ncbi:MAG: hypothetical protein O3A20_02500 [Planctomycetota bacterium]|nr:hypothetical protein [Planctomycetota bacterium]